MSGGAQHGKPGRPVGSVNRDRAELRALLQERVQEFTTLRARQDIEDGVPPDQAQVIIDEYDPVVALAITSVDRRTPLEIRVRCNAEVAQYVRPKLKSIEHTADADTLEELARRTEIADRILDIRRQAELRRQAALSGKKNPSDEGTDQSGGPSEGAGPDQVPEA